MEKIDTYRKQLSYAGFTEAGLMPCRFFRAATDRTAFVVNLTQIDGGVSVLHGFCSTALLLENEEFIQKYGVDETDCNLRNVLSIQGDLDEEKAEERIGAFYAAYCNVEKDELLRAAKERRKAFLQKFTDLLNPLGFQKSGNKWSKQVASQYTLTVDAQKSAYSDQYYFNISLHKADATSHIGCCTSRVGDIFNWQLMSDGETEALLAAVREKVNLLSGKDIEALGKEKWVWEHCMCSRKHCDTCWVEKNLWEAKEFEN